MFHSWDQSGSTIILRLRKAVFLNKLILKIFCLLGLLNSRQCNGRVSILCFVFWVMICNRWAFRRCFDMCKIFFLPVLKALPFFFQFSITNNWHKDITYLAFACKSSEGRNVGAGSCCCRVINDLFTTVTSCFLFGRVPKVRLPLWCMEEWRKICVGRFLRKLYKKTFNHYQLSFEINSSNALWAKKHENSALLVHTFRRTVQDPD